MVVVVKGDDKWWRVRCSNGLEVIPSTLPWISKAHTFIHKTTML